MNQGLGRALLAASIVSLALWDAACIGTDVVVEPKEGPGLSSSTSLSASTVGTPYTPGLVSWWGANGNGDDPVGGHDALLYNGLQFVPGHSRSAFGLDSLGEYARVTYHPDLNPSQLTVGAWVKFSSAPAIAYFALAKSGETGLNGFELSIASPVWGMVPGAARFSVLAGPGNPFGDAVGTTNLADGKFHHIAGTFDGATVRVYVDGVEEGADPFNGAIVYTDDDLIIGYRQHDFRTPFKGLIDDVVLFNRALSPSEIWQISHRWIAAE